MRMARSFTYAIGIAEDKEEAVKWFRKAANQGNATAQMNLGVCYSNGVGVFKDETEAVMWLCRAAVLGEQNAINLLKDIEEKQAETKSMGHRLFDSLSLPSLILPE